MGVAGSVCGISDRQLDARYFEEGWIRKHPKIQNKVPRQLFYLDTSTEEQKDHIQSLMQMNDEGKSFEEIANHIENNL